MKIHVKDHQEARKLLKEKVSHEADDVKKLTTGYSQIDFSYDPSIIVKLL